MRALVYGGGAVGLGIASCLLKSKCRVDIVARGNTVSALSRHGLIRTGIFGSFRADPETFCIYTSLNEISPPAYDYVLVCTKSFDSHTAAKDLSGHKFLFSKQTKIVLFQNGWGNAEVFLHFFSEQEIYNARVITGFRRLNGNEVVITVHADAIHIGSLFKRNPSPLNNLCELISGGDIPCETTGEIAKDLWAKMLYNCALNPLGAILDVPYGVLAQSEFTRQIMNEITEEVFRVMIQAGYGTHWKSPGEFLDVFYNRLVPDTAEHRSSTLQDIEAGKRTEMDALNGAIIRLAVEHKMQVPCNLVIYDAVKFIETRSHRR